MEPRTSLPRAACSKPRGRRGPNTKFSPCPWIKRDSAYRIGEIVVEYRWHPLHGKRVRLFRRAAHGGVAVIHVDPANDKVSRELPAWMVDSAICRAMEVGDPQVSLSALQELVKAIKTSSPAGGSRPVSSLEKENEPIEPTKTDTESAVATAIGVSSGVSAERERESGGRASLGRPADRGRKSTPNRQSRKERNKG